MTFYELFCAITHYIFEIFQIYILNLNSTNTVSVAMFLKEGKKKKIG